MKKIFTSLMLCLISVLSYATGYDTIYYKPNEPASLELAVDYEKYPYLEGVDVSWYVGFKEVDAGGQVANCAITQTAGDPELDVDQETINLDAEGTQQTLNVTSNTSWSITQVVAAKFKAMFKK